MRRLAEGSQALDAGRLAQAIQALREARAATPALRDYASFFLAKTELQSKHYREAAAAATDVVAFQPLSPLAARAASLGAQAFVEDGEARKALALLARVDEAGLPMPESAMIRARAQQALGATAEAARSLQLVFCRYPRSPEAREAAAALDQLRVSMGSDYPPPSAALRLERADKLRDADEDAAAKKEYESVAVDFDGADRATARVRAATMPYYSGNAAGALSALEGLGRQAGDVEGERLYAMVLCQRRLEQDSGLESSLALLARAAPTSPWRLRALSAVSNFYLVKDDPRQRAAFEACADSFPEASEATLCHWHVAWWAYRKHDPSAPQLLRQHLMRYPASEKAGAAVYYLARLAEKSGDAASALAWRRFLAYRYPNYYYTIVSRPALQRLEAQHLLPARSVEEFLAGVKFPERPRQADFRPNAATARRIERARLLEAAGLESLAENELRFGVRDDAQPWPSALELAEMATRNGAAERAMRHIKGVLPNYLFLQRDGAPLRFWRLAFQFPYRTQIEKYSRANGLDPFLVAALIRQESEFDPKAVSVSNAIGLMQVMPSSGRELARKARVKGFRTASLKQPEMNLRLGTMYFRRLLDSCEGRVEDALASYNAGHRRAVTWRGWDRYTEPSEFVETIPFTQTRDYVQIILRNEELYRWLYASSAASPAAGRAPAKAAPKSGAKKAPVRRPSS